MAETSDLKTDSKLEEEIASIPKNASAKSGTGNGTGGSPGGSGEGEGGGMEGGSYGQDFHSPKIQNGLLSGL